MKPNQQIRVFVRTSSVNVFPKRLACLTETSLPSFRLTACSQDEVILRPEIKTFRQLASSDSASVSNLFASLCQVSFVSHVLSKYTSRLQSGCLIKIYQFSSKKHRLFHLSLEPAFCAY